jgi:hypothetical protein
LIFVCKLFSPGQLQWLLPPMEVSKLQHQTKSSLWRSDDGLIPEKSKAEVYLGSMESKHTTRFTWKKRAKKINRFVYILTDFGIGCLVIIIYIGQYFLPIAYVIFILTQRLVTVIELGVIQCFSYILVSLRFLCHLTARFLFNLLEPWDVRVLSIRKTADLPLQLWVGTFPRFVAIRFYFLSETLI